MIDFMRRHLGSPSGSRAEPGRSAPGATLTLLSARGKPQHNPGYPAPSVMPMTLGRRRRAAHRAMVLNEAD